MRIIKDRIRKTRKYRIRCPACRSTLEYVDTDVRIGSRKPEDGDPDREIHYNYVRCEACNENIVLAPKVRVWFLRRLSRLIWTLSEFVDRGSV